MKGNLKAEDAFYAELLEFGFNRPGNLNSWVWDKDLTEPTAPPAIVTAAITRLCENSGEDLKSFTDLQVAGGLEYIFNNSFSDYSFDLLRTDLPGGLRHAFFQSLHTLFERCFAVRCDAILCHGKQEGPDNPLNSVCYMFWDVSPLSKGGHDALSVMENSLYLKNPACVESGLHGLGHEAHNNETRVQSIIDKFLRSHPKIPAELHEYALTARTGYIN
jgi:hypothetical protein